MRFTSSTCANRWRCIRSAVSVNTRAPLHAVYVFGRAAPNRAEAISTLKRWKNFWPSPSRLSSAQSGRVRSEEHTSELQSHLNLVCRLLLEKKKKKTYKRRKKKKTKKKKK